MSDQRLRSLVGVAMLVMDIAFLFVFPSKTAGKMALRGTSLGLRLLQRLSYWR